MNEFTRAFPIEDITVRSDGDGRTVEAYAAVFGVEAPISDRDGQYMERISPGAFDETISKRGTNFGVLYNHGMTIYGTPSDRGSMPIGTPVEVRADSRGLYTVTRYNNTPLADEALEAIRSGAIRAQSFQGRFLRSDIRVPRGGFRAKSDGSLQVVTRQEIALKEYGPTPFPAYDDASIVGVRAAFTFSPTEQAIFKSLLANLADGDDVLDDVTMQAVAVLGLDQALDCAEMYLSALLNVPDSDAADADAEDGMEGMGSGPDRSAALRRLEAVAVRLRAGSTSSSATGAVEQGTAQPSRQSTIHAYLGLRKQAREKGVL